VTENGAHNFSRRALFGLAPIAPAAVPVVIPAASRTITTVPLTAAGPATRDASIAQAVVVPAVSARRGKQYKSYSDAAKKAGKSASKLFPGYKPEAHLLRRATIGARPSDVADLKRLGINDWIDRQLSPKSFSDPQGDAAWKLYPLAGASAKKIIRKIPAYNWEASYQTAQASLARQVFTNRQLYEIVVDIFSNHLHVPVPAEQWSTGSSYISQVIRKHALGSFDDMLVAAMKHPAMLNFLNNDESRKENVNENLGRELLELHTVGVGKYSEKEVRASAAILSGRTWDPKTGKYTYDPTFHKTGRVKVLGFTHANKTGKGGHAVGDAYLKYLARHPATAKAIARKIAVRFVSDNPSSDLVNRLAKVYLKHDTSIKETVRAVFLSSDFWDAVGVRMRRPLEDAVGALRILDVRRTKKMATPMGWLFWNLDAAGHTPHGWEPPNGYPDVAGAWLGAGAMIQRWNLHRTFANGWWKDLKFTKPSEIVKRKKDMTTMAWTRAVAREVLGMVPPKRHLKAVIRGSRLKPGSPAPVNDWECGKVVSLLLDSPYFQLR
jgi:uncharacterized protein (DUF1800 family)